MLVPTTPRTEIAELQRLGDDIAELSAHIEVATARLLDMLREFDARAGWAEAGAVLRQALAAACDRLYAKARVNDPEGDPPSMGQRQADALGMIAEAALHHDLDPGAPGGRYQVVIHVAAPVLADPDQPGQSVLADGDHFSAENSRRVACDASRVI